MKIRYYPKTTTVKGILQKAIDLQEGVISELDTKLDKLNNSPLFTGGDTPYQVRTQRIQNVQHLDTLNKQMELLNSHDPPEVAAEFDL